MNLIRYSSKTPSGIPIHTLEDSLAAQPLGRGISGRQIAAFTREVNDFPNSTLSINTGISAGWIEQLAGITNVAIGIASGNLNDQILASGVVGTGVYSQVAPGYSITNAQQLVSASLVGFEMGRYTGITGHSDLDVLTIGIHHRAAEPLDLGSVADSPISLQGRLSTQLSRLAELKAGWDGETSEAVSAETKATAEDVIRSMLAVSQSTLATPECRIGPLPDGSVRFECTHGDKELFITVAGGTVEIQAWEPLDSIESVGFWETDASGTREQFEWLVK